MIGLLKRQYLFGAEKLKWFLLFSGIKISGSLSVQNFYACARAKKSDDTATFHSHSVSCKIALKSIAEYCVN